VISGVSSNLARGLGGVVGIPRSQLRGEFTNSSTALAGTGWENRKP